MSDLAALTVRLEAEISQYSASIQKATEQIGSFSDSVGSALANVADFAEDMAKKFAAAFTIDKIAEFLEGAIESAAAMERLSQESGVAVERLSALQAVFAQSGVGQDEMASSLKKLNTAISDAAGNPTSKASFAFQALGLSITNSNGSLKTAGQLLPQIADAYSRLADGPNKVAVNTDLLGKSAQALIPTLNLGAQGLDDLQAAAVASGAALSGDVAEAAENLERKFIALKQSVTGSLSTQTLEALVPTLTALVDGLQNIGASATPTNAALALLNEILKDLGAFALDLQGDFKELGNALSGVEDAAIAAAGGVKKALGAAFDLDAGGVVSSLSSTARRILGIYEDTSDQAQSINKASNDAIENLYSAGGKKQIDLTAEIAATIKSNLSHAFDGLNDASSEGVSPLLLQQLDAAQKKVTDFSDSIKTQASSFNLGSSASINFKLTTGAMGDAIALAKKELDLMTAGVLPFNQALADSANKTLTAAAAARTYAAQLQTKQDTKEIDDYTNKLQDQVIKFGQSNVAAIDFAATTGKLGAALTRAGAEGDAGRAHIHDLAVELDQLKGVDALSKLDSQLLTMTGHLEAASQAAFDLANRPLRITIQAAQDTQAFKGLDDAQKQIEVTTQINALNQQAIEIKDAMGKKIADVDAAGLASGKGALQLAGDEAAARQAAISQLEALRVKAAALGENGFPAAAAEAKNLQQIIASIQFNPSIIANLEKATELQKELTEAVEKQKVAADDAALEMAKIDKQNAQGSLTDLDLMFKQDDERKKQIADLEVLYQAQKKYADETGDPKAIAAYKQTGVAIENLETQLGQLAKTVRTDLTDDLTSAFVDFADGSKSASAALKSFVADFSKQMLSLAAKQLFQKLFDVTGITSGINSIFGAAKPAATSAASGLAGSDAAATSLSTAITTAAGTGGSAMGGAIEASGSLAGTSMATAITAAGSEAAAAMAQAITAAGAGSGGGSAAGGFASLFSSGAEEDASLATALASGGPLQANQLALVGEEGPELFVSDLGTHIIGAKGPEFIKPDVSGFVVPSDTFLKALSDRAAPGVPPQIVVRPDVRAMPVAPDSEGLIAPQPQVPAMPDQLDAPTSATIMKFENVVARQSHDMLDAYQYEALLTDRYLKKRAGGGPVSAGKPYLVGEAGPELMVPDANGTVMNSWQTQNNQNQPVIHLTNNFLIQSATGKVDRASQSQIAARTALSVQAASGRNN